MVMEDPSGEDQDEDLDDQGNKIVEMIYTPFSLHVSTKFLLDLSTQLLMRKKKQKGRKGKLLQH